MKPTILVFITSYYPFVGGAEIAVQETARRLSGEFDFLIITARQSKGFPKQEIRPEGKILRIGFGNRLDKWLLPVLAPFSYRGFASIVWGVDISQGSLAAIVLKFFVPQIPFVFTIQYGEGDARLKHGRLWAINLAFRLMLARANFVTAISHSLLGCARSYGYKGPAEIVHNGVDIKNFKSHSDYKKNNHVIVTASRLVKKNGIDILLRAVAAVKNAIPDVRCHILGDGIERKNLEFLAAQLHMRDSLQFFSNVPYEKLPAFLHEADLFVRPSRSEGMGNSFVEAIAAGIPIIGTPVGGIRDIIEDGKTGFFCKAEDPVSLAEKITYVFEHPLHAKETVERGKAMVEKRFSWEQITDLYRKIFLSAAARSQKIVIATPLFPPDIGGPATYSALLHNELPHYGIQTRVVSFGKVRHLPKIIRHTGYFLYMAKEARRADTVYALDPVSVGFPSFLAAFLFRAPFMIKIVGDYAWEQYQNKFSIFNVQFSKSYHTVKSIDEFQYETYDAVTEVRRYIQRYVAKRAKNVIVPSGYLKKIVSGWGVDKNKIKIIFNSFEAPDVAVSKEEARRKIGLSGTIIVSAGRLVPWKGFDALIDLMPEIIKEIPDAKLLIIGDGPEMPRLLSRISWQGLQKQIIFTGRISHSDLLLHMRAGDIFVLNTEYEGFSHTILEAMSFGVPVITTRVCGNPEIVDHMKNGILVEYNNKEEIKKAIFLLHRDTSLHGAIAAEARKKAGEFSKERMMKKTIHLLRTVL